jgi:hypothetical protein
MRSAYLNKFFQEDLPKQYPPIGLVVLGDSTSKSAVNPTNFKYLFGVNLALNGGTALTAYHVLERYLASYPHPKCVLYVSQYNWKRNYGDFFHKTIFYSNLDWHNFKRVWEIGVENGIYPATDYTHAGYLLAAARTRLMLDELPLNLIQELVMEHRPRKLHRALEMKRRMINNRGFQDNTIKRPLTEPRFFNEMHAAFLEPFEAYASEDFYLRALARLSRENKIHFFYAMLPVAESGYVRMSEPHLQLRNAHFRELFATEAGAINIPLPSTLPSDYYYDFTHMVRDGANALAPRFDPYLEKYCATGAG